MLRTENKNVRLPEEPQTFYSILINVRLTLIESGQELPGHKHRFGFIAIVFKILAITIFRENEPAAVNRPTQSKSISPIQRRIVRFSKFRVILSSD